jgi:hypothetical protein
MGAGGAPGAAVGRDPLPALRWERDALVLRSRHYLVRSDLDGALTRSLAQGLDRMAGEYALLMSGLREPGPAAGRLRVYLFRDEESYLSALELRFDAPAAGSAGLTLREGGDVTLAAWQGGRPVQELERTLRHEGFHQFRQVYFPAMPPWADEGLAQLFEAAVVLEGGGVLLGEAVPSWVGTIREAGPRDGLLDLSGLFELDAERWNDHVAAGSGALQYAAAWAVVHFLVFGEGGRYVPSFERFLVLMNRGMGWRAAFREAFGVRDLGPLAGRLRQHLQELRPTDFAETVARLEFLAAGHLALCERGIEPASLKELRASLGAAGFRYDTGRFGIRRRLEAEDDSVFTVPGTVGGAEGPVFVLREEQSRSRRSTVRMDDAEGECRGAPRRCVATRGVRPFDLRIAWDSDTRSGVLQWHLVSEPSGACGPDGR